MQPRATAQRAHTIYQVAERLNVSPRTVWAWIAAGRLHALKLGTRTTRIPESSVAEFLRSCEEAE